MGASLTCISYYGETLLSLKDLFIIDSINYFEIQMTRGVWRTSSWGIPSFSPPSDGVLTVANLKNRMKSLREESLAHHQTLMHLRSILSGVLCTSIRHNTVSSSIPFLVNISLNNSNPTTNLWVSHYSSDSVCSDNINNLLQLLPCGGKGKLGSLLNPQWFVKAPWMSTSLRIDMSPLRCKDDIGPPRRQVCVRGMNTTITLSLVTGSNRKTSDSQFIPSANKQADANTYSRGKNGKTKKGEKELDILSALETLIIRPDDRNDYNTVAYKDRTNITNSDIGLIDSVNQVSGLESECSAAVPLLTVGTRFSVPIQTPTAVGLWKEFINGSHDVSEKPQQVPLILRSELIDSRDRKVELLVMVRNTHVTAIRVTITQPLPSFLQLFYSESFLFGALNSIPNGRGRTPLSVHLCPIDELQSSSRQAQFGQSSYASQPTVTWAVTVPPNSSVTAYLYFEKNFVKRESMPADASRGLEFPPTIATYETTTYLINNHIVTSTTSFLVSLPIADASMPYNVITMVCALMSFLLGTFVNLLGRKSSRKHVDGKDFTKNS